MKKKAYLLLNSKKLSKKIFKIMPIKNKINIKLELQNCWKNLSLKSYLNYSELKKHSDKTFVIKNNSLSEYLNIKNIKKQKYKKLRFLEKRNLKRLNNFFKFFGFRQNWNRPEQNLRKTKKFKKFTMYKKILNFFNHHKTYSDETKKAYLIQPIRTFLSYYKMRWQAVTFFLKNIYSSNLARRKISKFAKTSNNFQKNKIVTFISKIEFTISSMILKMRLLATKGLANQFIRHGNVYVNYKKVIHPLFKINAGDTISIFIDPIKYYFHKISDPLYIHRLCTGLYRRNSGRQSFSVLEPNSFIIKNSLATFKKKSLIKNLYQSRIRGERKIICKNLNWQIQNYYLNNNFNIKYKKKLYIKCAKNKNNFTNWKHSFILNPATNLFIKQRPYLDKLYNVLI